MRSTAFSGASLTPYNRSVDTPEELRTPVDAEETYDFAQLLREDSATRATAVDRTAGNKLIEATVVAVSADSVFLDIGYKTEGVLPLTTFRSEEKAVEPGDKLRVSVRGRDVDGYYELTRQHQAAPQDFTSLEEAFEAKGTVLGTVTGVVKGGLTIDIGMRAFMPSSRTGTRDAAEMEKLVGQQVRVRITQLDLEGSDERGGNRPDAIVDRRSVLEEEARTNADARFAELAEGQVVSATVRSLTDFGAFVDLDGADALLHISDMAWSRVSSPADVVRAGDILEVKILKIDNADPVKRRIAVGLKQLQPHPWDSVMGRFAIGQKVSGTVTRDADFGAFVEVAPGIEGLIHISELAWGKKVRKPSDVVKVGDQVEAVILSLDPESKRMGLGLKQALGDPFAEMIKTIHAGAVIEGKVARLTTFGAFIEVISGVEGLVHISEIMPVGEKSKRLNHPSEELHVGQTVKAKVLEIDSEKRQLKLSIKQMVPTGIDDFLAEQKPGDQVTGRVIDIDAVAGTARIELGEGILASVLLPAVASEVSRPADAPIDLSQLGALLNSKWKTADSPSKPGKLPIAAATQQKLPAAAGQIRSFSILSIDPESKQIVLELL